VAVRFEEVSNRDADGFVYFNNDGNGCVLRDASAFAPALVGDAWRYRAYRLYLTMSCSNPTALSPTPKVGRGPRRRDGDPAGIRPGRADRLARSRTSGRILPVRRPDLGQGLRHVPGRILEGRATAVRRTLEILSRDVGRLVALIRLAATTVHAHAASPRARLGARPSWTAAHAGDLLNRKGPMSTL
jgi:hypothetical protein